MTIEAGAHVLVDTNVIIESHRTGCWSLLVGYYQMDTVCKCVEECATGNQRSYNPVPVDTSALQSCLQPKTVNERMIADLILSCPGAVDLDPGEQELLAHAITLEYEYFFCSPDRACVRTGYELGILDNFVSLEELVEDAGGSANLKSHYSKQWMQRERTQIILDSI